MNLSTTLRLLSTKSPKNWKPGIRTTKTTQPIKISVAARRDVNDILRWSLDNFGINAEVRYRALLNQAIRDIATDPTRPGSRARPNLAGDIRTYHLALSRKAVEGNQVKTPKHFILYRLSPKLEILRILHDGRDLALHLPPDDWN